MCVECSRYARDEQSSSHTCTPSATLGFVRLRVRYHRLADLVRDYDEQLARGGFLVRVSPAEVLQQFQSVELEIVAPRGSLVLDAQVVQYFSGVGVAVTFTPLPALVAAVNNARKNVDPDDASGGEPEHSVVKPGESMRAPDTDRDLPVAPPMQTPRAVVVPGPVDRMQQAIHGTRDERAAVLRDPNTSLHVYVLRNPSIQLDEVVGIAKMRTVSPELLKAIADRREWIGRPEIALALVRNPKTAVPVALRALEFVGPAELRVLAKDQNVRTPIAQAARRKVVG